MKSNKIVILTELEAVMSNPNGDPDLDNNPRTMSDGRGFITGVSVKRKFRDSVLLKKDHICAKMGIDPETIHILEESGRDRDLIKEELKSIDSSKFKDKYIDARLLGSLFLEEDLGKGYIKTGGLQVGTGESISPVNIITSTLTNKAGVQKGKSCGMAPQAFKVVEHGVYTIPFYFEPSQAEKSGCLDSDLDILFCVLPHIYEWTRSMIRCDVRMRHIWVITYKDDGVDGLPDYIVTEAFKPIRIGDPNTPSTSYRDYAPGPGLTENQRSMVEDVKDLMEIFYK